MKSVLAIVTALLAVSGIHAFGEFVEGWFAELRSEFDCCYVMR